MKLGELADRLGASLHGDADRDITGVAGLEHAGPADVTFLANPKYTALARTTAAAAVLVDSDFPPLEQTATLHLNNPYLAFANAIALFYRAPQYAAGIHPTACINSTATLGEDAHVGAYAVVGAHVRIGRGAVLLPHTVVYEGAEIGDRFFAHAHAVVREFCVLGDDVTLQNGAIIGADGFGFANGAGGAWVKIVQSGRAVLADGVEVQANACIDRASVGETRIGRGSKIDNLVQVGHGSTVGEHTLLCAQVGLAGSTTVGNRVILAGQVGVAGHCSIGDGVIVTAQSGVPNDIPSGKTFSGYPAMDNRQWLRSVAAFTRLPELVRGVRELRRNEQP